MNSRLAGTSLRQLGRVLFASGPAPRVAAEPACALPGGGAPTNAAVWLLGFPSARCASTVSAPVVLGGGEAKKANTAAAARDKAEQKAVVSYWGVPPSRVTKEDGSEWRWACFRPWETYEADLSIDLKKHHAPTTFLDKVAFWTVKTLRWPTDVFFQRRYGCRAMMLETVAAVPGMVVGYLEEEAIHSYTEFLKEIDGGTIENVPAPAIALDYWRLPQGSTLRDVVMVVRADEAHHRDVNHFASDIHYQGLELKTAAAPLAYH